MRVLRQFQLHSRTFDAFFNNFCDKAEARGSSIILFLDGPEADETIFANNFRDFYAMPPHPMYCFASFPAGGPP